MLRERPEDTDTGLDLHVAERYFTKPAIAHRMPEHSRDPRTALALLESEVLLDGDPMKNLATFVTTFMEPNAIKVIAANLHRNYIGGIERALRNVSLHNISKIAHGLGVPIAELFPTKTRR